MIQTYEEFLLENKIYTLLLESKVSFSSDFKKILKRIDSPIATLLLEVEYEDLPVTSNYFDVDTKETISFIADAKAKKLESDERKKEVGYLKSQVYFTFYEIEDLIDEDEKKELNTILSEYGDAFQILHNLAEASQIDKKEPGEIIRDIDTEDDGEFILVKFGDKFLLTREFALDFKEAVWVKNRQSIRIGRGIKAILKSITSKQFSDAQIEDFVNKFKSSFDWLNDAFRNFEIVKGEDIAHYYFYTNYERTMGSLGNSCMSRIESTTFEIYTKNPEVCQLVILKSEKIKGTITGRALLWKIDDDHFFMDRIYTVRDSDVNLFRQWATKNGYWYKSANNSASDEDTTKPDGTVNYIEHSIKIKKLDYAAYPYVDTLKYMTEYSDYATLSNDQDGADFILESVGGSRFDIVCQVCNNTHLVICQTCYGEGKLLRDCEECFGRGRQRCRDCSGSGVVDTDSKQQSCEKCDGFGFHDCVQCNGEGHFFTDCLACAATGEVECPRCS